MTRRRVVVTGMGAVTPLGNDVQTFWDGLVRGESGVATIARWDPERVTSKIAGEVKDFDPSGVLDRKEIRRNDRYTQFALVATREALDHAGLPGRLEGELADRTGTLVGSGMGGTGTLVEQIGINVERGPDRISPFFIPMAISNMASGQTAISFGARGPNFATVSACATAGHAIGEASEIIIRGDADMMIAGGSEAPVFEAFVGAFAAMRALSTRNDDPEGASRPFDQGRDGFVIAEGAAVLILEELETARKRGARILAELTGYGATADAAHITLPAPGGEGGARAARRALEKARMDPTEIDHVSAHATSTPEGDPAELMGFKTVFGDHLKNVSVTATKSAIGHTLGAAGGIGAVASINAINQGCVPPTLNLVDPTPEAEGLDLTPLEARRRDVRAALVNAFGFGGQNAALVFRRWEESGMTKPESPELIDLIDQLEKLLNDSELSELEIEAGQTGLLLRKPGAVAEASASVASVAASGGSAATTAAEPMAEAPAEPQFSGHVIAAPLTGLFYNSPSPGAEPYVREGGEVSVGQVIGLIEAMKLFNEIKSDVTGRVVRIHAESGALVKTKQPLIEVQP